MGNRLEVMKTYKIFIGGKFPRTESGRYYVPKNPKGSPIGNICLSSRKDVRNAVVAARKAQDSWAGRTAYNRGQIIYRMAENMEAMKDQFANMLLLETGQTKSKCILQIEECIDLMVHYAGWSDKYQQIFSSVNPVSSAHFNFSILESMGIVGAVHDANSSFYDLIHGVLCTLIAGNSILILAPENHPLSAYTFAELTQNSDVPAGVINILTGKKDEMLPHLSSHMDVNAILYSGENQNSWKLIQENSIHNLKRNIWWKEKQGHSPYRISDFSEVKTTWHPIEQIGGSKPGY